MIYIFDAQSNALKLYRLRQSSAGVVFLNMNTNLQASLLARHMDPIYIGVYLFIYLFINCIRMAINYIRRYPLLVSDGVIVLLVDPKCTHTYILST